MIVFVSGSSKLKKLTEDMKQCLDNYIVNSIVVKNIIKQIKTNEKTKGFTWDYVIK